MEELDDILQKISEDLIVKNLTIATAESCTGGLIGHLLTNIPGSSTYYVQGVISYSNQSKMELLDVPKEMLETYGAVSEPVAKVMAEGIRKKADVDIGLSSTGIAGPSGGSEEKPVGLVYIGLSNENQTMVHSFQFSGSRIDNKYDTAKHAFNLLMDSLKQY